MDGLVLIIAIVFMVILLSIIYLYMPEKIEKSAAYLQLFVGTSTGVDKMNIVLKDDEKVQVRVEPKTRAGNPAPVDGDPTWDVSDSSVCSVVVNPDNALEAEVITTGALGITQVTVKVDADLGDGIEELVGIINVEVVAGKAVSLGVLTSTPEPRDL